MGSCGSCGSCGGCEKGCDRSLELTQGEIEILHTLGQIPFLPVARNANSDQPYYLEDERHTAQEYSLILQHLEQKGLISLDFDKPLSGFDESRYRRFSLLGSMALTARGQRVLEQIELIGVEKA